MIALHAGFFACAAAITLLDAPEKGWAVLALVVAYNVALPLVARAAGRRDWVALWAFLLALSVFQIVPDWILADLIGTLRFPDIGGPRLDGVITLAMGGMWVAPLFIVLAMARGRAFVAAGLAVVVFLGSELLAPVMELWEPTGDTARVAGVAWYVLPAEAAAWLGCGHGVRADAPFGTSEPSGGGAGGVGLLHRRAGGGPLRHRRGGLERFGLAATGGQASSEGRRAAGPQSASRRLFRPGGR